MDGRIDGETLSSLRISVPMCGDEGCVDCGDCGNCGDCGDCGDCVNFCEFVCLTQLCTYVLVLSTPFIVAFSDPSCFLLDMF